MLLYQVMESRFVREAGVGGAVACGKHDEDFNMSWLHEHFVSSPRQSVSDRYYRALYSKLLDPQICSTSKLAIFLNVLYKSLKSDPELNRVKVGTSVCVCVY